MRVAAAITFVTLVGVLVLPSAAWSLEAAGASDLPDAISDPAGAVDAQGPAAADEGPSEATVDLGAPQAPAVGAAAVDLGGPGSGDQASATITSSPSGGGAQPVAGTQLPFTGVPAGLTTIALAGLLLGAVGAVLLAVPAKRRDADAGATSG